MRKSLVCAVFMTLFVAAAWAGGHKKIVPPPKIDIDPVVEAAVIEVVHATADRWNSQDFATVLELWDAFAACGSTSARGRFCDKHYLGFRRMREWADVRHQLWQSLREALLNQQNEEMKK